MVVPGGFSYGDYLRCGAIAARSPIMEDIRAKALKGLKVLGVCNGFQIITEAGLLPGALVRNADLRFVCKRSEAEGREQPDLLHQQDGEGRHRLLPRRPWRRQLHLRRRNLKRLEGENRVVFRYAENTNPNGALNDIAGIMNEQGTVIGMMPHPENMIEPLHGRTDCRPLFESLLAA